MKYFLSSIFAILSLLCSYPAIANGSGNKSVINIEPVVGKGAVHKVSDFVKEIRYIPLETNSKIFIGNIKEIKIHDEKMYISDDKNVLNIFDMTGRHLSTLNRLGRGPEEYLSLTDFEVTPEGHIFIASQREGIIEYGPDLKFIRKITPSESTDAAFSDFMILKQGIFISNIIAFSRDYGMKQQWRIYNDSFKTLLSYDILPPASIASRSGTGGNQSSSITIMSSYRYYMHNEYLNIFRSGNDTIFNIDYKNNYSKSPRYIINSGQYRHSERREGISLSSLAEADNYLFVVLDFRRLAPEPFEEKLQATVGALALSGTPVIRSGTTSASSSAIGTMNNTKVNAIYNKTNGTLVLLNQPIPKTPGLKDDISNGPPFWPKNISAKQELISWHNALDLVTLAEEGKIDKSVIGNLKEDDNPVVVIAVPK